MTLEAASQARRAQTDDQLQAHGNRDREEILAEVFNALPGEVEEMIQRRIEERSWTEENELWPVTFMF